MEAQDSNTKKLLEKDNPNSASTASTSSRTGAGRAATTGTARVSLRDQIAARRKEAAAAAAQAPKLDPAPFFAAPPSVASSSTSHTPGTERSGLSSAPVRPSRPMRPKSQLSVRVDESKRPASSSSNGDSASAIERTLERMNGNRAMSPSSSARSGFSPSSSYKKSSAASPPGSTRIARSTVKHSPLSQRKMTILEQLNHPDYKVRLEGIVVLGCVLAGRTPPNYDKRPPVPSADQLAPALQKLLNDSNPEVVESVLAPEVLPELIKFVGYDQIVPRVLLLNEVDETEHPRPYPTKSLASLKELLEDSEAADLLFRVITSMGASGVMARKLLQGGISYTTIQRRRILHGALEWMNDLLGGDEVKKNAYIDQPDTYKLLINRLVPLVPTTKQPNFTPLANLIKNIKARNPVIFDRILATFDPAIQRELKKAWGMKEEDEGGVKPEEEEVAHVEKVLGIMPSVTGMPPPPRPNRGLVDVPDITQRSDFINDDEELTMINPMSALAKLNLGVAPSTSTITPAASEVRSMSDSIDIPDLLGLKGTNGASTSVSKTLEPIQVYQDPAVSPLDFGKSKEPEPLANITNSVRQRQKNFGASTTTGKTPEQQLQTLQNYLRKLRDGDIDPHGLRRLCAIVRDNPVRKQQENKDSVDFWAGGQTFEDMLDSLLDFMGEPLTAPTKTAEQLSDVRAQGVQLLRLLMTKATPYFTGREPSVFPVSFKLRGEYPTQSPVSVALEDMIEEYVEKVADSNVALPTITGFLMKVTNIPAAPAEGGGKKKAGANVLALKTLAAFIKESDEEDLVNHWPVIGSIGKRYMEDEDPEVRRAVVNMCCEMRRRFIAEGGQGEAKMWEGCLSGLSDSQRNLLTYYFARNAN
ncbi:hypothetical protein AA313_de0209298 [Arthrobotrys entomopaga]|nr:hypothetical protein AA313_de0209298 [Arthrobotrys entomopaga]